MFFRAMRRAFIGVCLIGVTCLQLVKATGDAETDPDPQVLVTPRGDPAPFPHFPAVTALPVLPVDPNPLPPPTFEFAQGVPQLPLQPQQHGLPFSGPIATAAAPIFPVTPAVPVEQPVLQAVPAVTPGFNFTTHFLQQPYQKTAPFSYQFDK